MGLKIYIFEEDKAFLDLLTLYLSDKGHFVKGFSGHYRCPLNILDEDRCPAQTPCTDAVLINTKRPTLDRINRLLDQEQKGCKLPNHNKAIMSAVFTEEQEQTIQDLGFSTIKKPFRLAKLDEWLNTCKRRLSTT